MQGESVGPMQGEAGTLRSEGERALAGRVAGVLWVLGGLSIGGILLLPGTVTEHWRGVLPVAAGAVAWGLVCLRLDWTKRTPLIFHITSVLALACVAVSVALTGGSDSPTWILLFYIAAFCAYFYSSQAALPYLLGCALVAALPFVYDRKAYDEDLADFLLAAPAFFVVGGVVLIGKRRLIDLRRQAYELSLRDPLTGLANRRALIERIGAIGGARRTDATGLLMIDIDDFKDTNTVHGHPVGDLVLQGTAEALRRSSRSGDLVGRLGGDEFAVVVAMATEETMRRLAERVLASVREAGAALGLEGLKVSASAGWALYPGDAASGDDLVRAADIALRKAKAEGKDRTLGSPDRASTTPAHRPSAVERGPGGRVAPEGT